MSTTIEKVQARNYPHDEVITCKLAETNGTKVKLKFRIRGDSNWIFFEATVELGQKLIFRDGQEIGSADEGVMFTDFIPRNSSDAHAI